MKDLTVILPIHKINDEIVALTKSAVESFKQANTDGKSELLVIGPHDVIDGIKKEIDIKSTFVTVDKDEDTSFSHLINRAVEEVKTKYFSILEFDDRFTSIWFKNVEKYVETGLDASFILPLTEIYDIKDQENPIAYINECVWAMSFSEEIGYFDEQSLQDYMIFNMTGGIFNKEDFIEIGGLKESMKLSFWYEFILRAVYNKKRVFVIPKVGYHHSVNREDSLTEYYVANMKEDEYNFWVDTAKKEYLFKKDRNKTYE